VAQRAVTHFRPVGDVGGGHWWGIHRLCRVTRCNPTFLKLSSLAALAFVPRAVPLASLAHRGLHRYAALLLPPSCASPALVAAAAWAATVVCVLCAVTLTVLAAVSEFALHCKYSRRLSRTTTLSPGGGATAHSALTSLNKPVPTTPYSPGGGISAHTVY
jgi:hypothetical protein